MELVITKCERCEKKMVIVKGVSNAFTIIALCTECSPSQKITLSQHKGTHANGIIGVPLPKGDIKRWQVRITADRKVSFRQKEE